MRQCLGLAFLLQWMLEDQQVSRPGHRLELWL